LWNRFEDAKLFWIFGGRVLLIIEDAPRLGVELEIRTPTKKNLDEEPGTDGFGWMDYDIVHQAIKKGKPRILYLPYLILGTISCF